MGRNPAEDSAQRGTRSFRSTSPEGQRETHMGRVAPLSPLGKMLHARGLIPFGAGGRAKQRRTKWASGDHLALRHSRAERRSSSYGRKQCSSCLGLQRGGREGDRVLLRCPEQPGGGGQTQLKRNFRERRDRSLPGSAVAEIPPHPGVTLPPGVDSRCFMHGRGKENSQAVSWNY